MRQIISAFTAICLVHVTAFATELDATEQAMAAWIDAHAEDAISLLAETVNISSGTMNHQGVRKVGAVLRRELDAIGLQTDWIAMPPEVSRAGHLVAKQDGNRGKKILMIGHLDTVYEADDAFQAWSRDGNTASGPGTDDMKSGNVVMVYALKALQAAGQLEGMPVFVIYTGDEEKSGRPLSITRKDLIEAGKWADVALGFESASRVDGQDYAVIARRSSNSFRLVVSGKQSHSSRIFREGVGAGAIFEAARILNSFYDELRGEEYLSFNAGTIQGGTDVDYDSSLNRGKTFGKTNVVPQKVIVHGGIRTISQEQLDRTQEAMREIVARHLPLTDATISFGTGGYPAMAPTEGNIGLQRRLSEINVALGRGSMPAYDPALRGAADVSFVAPYTDALAGMGAIGRGAHSPNESVQLDSLPVAIKRAAILMYRLSQQ